MYTRTRRSRTAKSSDYRSVERLEQVPNIGPSLAADLRSIGIAHSQDLPGSDPYALYDRLCRVSGACQDPCVLDTFIAAVRFMEGAPAHPWWHYTAERKAAVNSRSLAARGMTKSAVTDARGRSPASRA